MNNDRVIIDVSFMSVINLVHYSRDANFAQRYLVELLNQFLATYNLKKDIRS